MSDEVPRRVKKQPPKSPTGYRSTRRGSKSAKNAKRAERQHELSTRVGRAARTVRNIGYYIALTVGVALVGMLVLLLVASAINTIARWSAKQHAGSTQISETERRARENVLVIGVQAGKATGFLALRVAPTDKQVYGIAIPDGALVEVPGEGFGSLGDSYTSNADVSLSAVSNYLTVPFRKYVVVPAAAYQQAMKAQSVQGLLDAVTSSNLTSESLVALRGDIASIPRGNTAIVPMPVVPVHLGAQTYFEPQKEKIADLLTQWWGIDPASVAQVTRVILYNGAGVPELAGEAAKQLIHAGLRVVDTKNADNFNYAQTLVIVQHGDVRQGNDVARILGVGQVKSQASDQNVADVIVIVGKDYKPPSSGPTGGKK